MTRRPALRSFRGPVAGAAALALAASLATPAGAGGHHVGFESDPAGYIPVRSPFTSGDSDAVSFAGEGTLYIFAEGDVTNGGHSLVAIGTPDLRLHFAVPVQAVSLAFGNGKETETASLRGLDADGALVASATMVTNDSKRIDQTISIERTEGGDCFTEAVFATPGSNAALYVDDVAFEACTEDEEPEPVGIDIRPGSDHNTVVPHARGRLSVAVLSGEDFDATTIDPASAAFGPDGASPVGEAKTRDVDGDGDLDLVLSFRIADTGIDGDDTEACLTATGPQGEVDGCDAVSPQGTGAERPAAKGRSGR